MFKLNFKKLLAPLLALTLCITPMAIQAQDTGYNIDNYYVQATYHKDNTISVQETIDVNMKEYSHGIIRSIPEYMYVGYTKEEDPNQTKSPDEYTLEIKDINVTGDAVSVEYEDGYQNLKLGDSNTTIIGQHTYNISYTIVIPEDYHKDYDFMYYSVLGSEWDTYISHFQFDITFEKALTKNELNSFSVYSGTLGETTNALNVDYEVTKNGISGSAYSINANNAITIYDRLRSDYFVGAKQATTWPSWAFSILALIFAILALLRIINLRKNHITPVINFYPPKDLDPAAVGYLVDESSDVVDLMSLVPYWASKGFLSIEEKEKETILHKEKDIPEDALDYQNTIFTSFFGKGIDERSMKKLPSSFAKRLENAQNQLSKHYTGNQKLTKMDNGFGLLILSFLFFFLAIFTNSKVGLWAGIFFAAFSLIILVLEVFICFTGTVKLTFSSKTKLRIRQVLGILLYLVFLLILTYQSSFASSILPIYWVLLIAIVLLIDILNVQKFNVSSDYWNELAGPLLGFKEFIQKAELDQLKKLSEENPTYYYDVIPYAMVFGLSKEWSKKFTNIPITQPTWYRTYSYNPYSSMMYYSMLNRGVHTPVKSCYNTYRAEQMKAAANAARSSGGGGFSGGFSGGGAGGGGGSRW